MAKEIFTAEWFPYYFERFDGSDRVAVMSLTEEGAYHRAIRLAWKWGSVPADPELLAAKIQKRCTVKTAERVLKCFKAMPGKPSQMIHPVVEEIRNDQEKKFLGRRKGGKAGAAKRWGQETSENPQTMQNGSAITQVNSANARVEIRDKREKKEESEADSSKEKPPPLLEIHTGKILSGVAKELGIKRLSPSATREWENEARLAFENEFSADRFLETFAVLRKIRPYTIKPNYVTDSLPELDRLRKQLGNGKPPPNNDPPPLKEKLAADAEARRNAKLIQPPKRE